MPWDEAAELSVLGACMIDGEVVIEASTIVQPESFYAERHRRLFAAMQAIAGRGEPVDPVTIQAELVSRQQFDSVGGFDAIVAAMNAVVTAANVAYHARLVQDCARRRQLITAGTEIVRNAYEPDGVPVSVLVDRAEHLVANCAEQATGEVGRVKDDLFDVIARMEALQQNPGQLAGLSWGIAGIDDMTGGLHKGDLVILAARPSMGKTAAVTGTLLNAGIGLQKPVALFSLEMSKSQVVQRMLCSEALVDISRFLRGNLSDDDFGRIAQAAGHLNSAPIFIDDTGALSTMDLRAKMRRLLQIEPDLALVAVDYIQLMRGGNEENRQQEVSAISRGLKAIAKEFDVPIIALSQLSRAPEARSNHRPQLSDLRESGSLEQDADVVAFLYRPEYYLSSAEANEKGVQGKAELIFGKQRNGPTGTVDLHFRKECARFEGNAQGQLGSWGNR